MKKKIEEILTRDMLRTGIVGCGKVAHLHAQALRNLVGSDFAAVFSRTLSKAQDFGNQYGVSAYDNISKMVADEKLDRTFEEMQQITK